MLGNVLERVSLERVASNEHLRKIGMTYVVPVVPPIGFTTAVFDESELELSVRADEMRYLVPDKEHGVGPALRDHLDAGGTFFDIGAHIGYYSVLAGELVGDTGQVVAFEPLPSNAERIREQAELNDISIRVEEIALADRTGKAELSVPERRYNTTIVGADTAERLLTAPVTKLDQWVTDNAVVPDVVKIDVEGAELEVLEGMTETMQQHRPTIVCEVEGRERERTEEILSTMERQGYELLKLPERESYTVPELADVALAGGQNDYGMAVQLHVLAR